MKKIHIGLILLAGLVLAGCGGSSSTTAAAPTSTAAKVTIDSSNQSTITTAAITSAKSQIGSGASALSMVGGVQASTSPSNDRFLTRLSNIAINKFIEVQGTPLSVTGAATNISWDCATLQQTSNTTNVIKYESDGATYANITYVQCTTVDPQNSNNSSVWNGTQSLSGVTTTKIGTVVSGIAATIAINMAATWNYNGTAYNYAVTGGYKINATGINTASRSDTISGTSLNVTLGPKYDTLSNFSFNSVYDDTPFTTPLSYSDTITYTYASDTIAAAFDFATSLNKPLVTYGTELYPRSGQFVITSSNAIRLTILPTNAGTVYGEVTVEYSTDGGTTWGPATLRTWATL